MINITSQLLGGIGNMLFTTATAYSISTEFNLNQVLSLNHIGAMHTSPDKYVDNIFRKLQVVESVDDYQLVNETSFAYSPIKIPIDKNIKLFGYFQSEKYFAKLRSQILELFSPTDEILNEIYIKYGDLYKNKTLSLHIRRGNYVNLSNIYQPIAIDYYYKALDYFPNHNVLVFSDDIEYCKIIFKNKNFYFIENERDIIDLYMMSLCNHNVIVNSTFSWWGAWLNKNKNNVVCPTMWFREGYYDNRDIIPDSWIKI